MAVKKLCLGDTVVFDRDEIMDAIYGLTPPLAVQWISSDDYDKTLWAVPDINGMCEFSSNSKLYNYLLADSNLGTNIADPHTGSDFRRLGPSGRIYIPPGSVISSYYAGEEFDSRGVAWYWDLSEANRIIFPRTKHFLNNTYAGEFGQYSQDQIVDITGSIDDTHMIFTTNAVTSNVFKNSVVGVTSYGAMITFSRPYMTKIDFKASNSPGVNVGPWVQPRATALRLAFYVGFLKQSQYKDL